MHFHKRIAVSPQASSDSLDDQRVVTPAAYFLALLPIVKPEAYQPSVSVVM